jgi:hypothetical protein
MFKGLDLYVWLMPNIFMCMLSTAEHLFVFIQKQTCRFKGALVCSSGPSGRWRCSLSLAIGRQCVPVYSPDMSWRHFWFIIGQLPGTKVLENTKSAESSESIKN